MTRNINIRRISAADAPRITEPSEELGYPLDPSLIAQQIDTIITDPTHFTFVATIENEVVGYIHGFIAMNLTSAPFIEIGALIVHEKYRNQGIGGKLIHHLEQYAGPSESIRVRCNVNREFAHKFYTALDFKEIKEQKIFSRKLSSAPK